jgi:serine/threonine protein kinase
MAERQLGRRKKRQQARTTITKSKTAVASAVAHTDTPEWRLRLAKDIADGTLKVDYPMCDLSMLNDIAFLAKNSASITGMFPAKHSTAQGDSRKIIMKASFDVKATTYNEDNSLAVEIVMYRLIANEMIKRHWTPHLASFVGAFQCSASELKKTNPIAYSNLLGTEFEESLANEGFNCPVKKPQSVWCAAKNKNAEVETDYDVNGPDPKVNFVMTEALQGKKLAEWMKTARSLEEWKSVLFQILYTLECFNRIGFRHNDLHLDNIFIEKTAVPEYYYVIDVDKPVAASDVKYLRVPTSGWSARIYDFDRSTLICKKTAKMYPSLAAQYALALQQHPIIFSLPVNADFCLNTLLNVSDCKWGACNEENPKFDAFTVLGLIWASDPIRYKTIMQAYRKANVRKFGGLFSILNNMPKDVDEFIERHIDKKYFHVLWGWAMIVGAKTHPDGSVEFGRPGNFVLPDDAMNPVAMMLHDRHFFDFEEQYGCPPHILFLYHLPSPAYDDVCHPKLLLQPEENLRRSSSTLLLNTERPKVTQTTRGYLIEIPGRKVPIEFDPLASKIPRQGLHKDELSELWQAFPLLASRRQGKKEEMVDVLVSHIQDTYFKRPKKK